MLLAAKGGCFCPAAWASLVRLSAIAWQSFSSWLMTLTKIHPHLLMLAEWTNGLSLSLSDRKACASHCPML